MFAVVQQEFQYEFDGDTNYHKDFRDYAEKAFGSCRNDGGDDGCWVVESGGREERKDSDSTDEEEKDVRYESEKDWWHAEKVLVVEFGAPRIKASTDSQETSKNSKSGEDLEHVAAGITQEEVQWWIEEWFDPIVVLNREAGTDSTEVEELVNEEVGKEQTGKGEFLKNVHGPVPFARLARSVGNTASPDGQGLDGADYKSRRPTSVN